MSSLRGRAGKDSILQPSSQAKAPSPGAPNLDTAPPWAKPGAPMHRSRSRQTRRSRWHLGCDRQAERLSWDKREEEEEEECGHADVLLTRLSCGGKSLGVQDGRTLCVSVHAMKRSLGDGGATALPPPLPLSSEGSSPSKAWELALPSPAL